MKTERISMVQPPAFLTDPVGYLRHYLPTDYVPPYGTQLTPENFDPCTDASVRTRPIQVANAVGSADTYRLHITTADSTTGRQLAMCEGPDGMMLHYLHPHTKRTSQQASVELWFDFLAIIDAEARQLAARRNSSWKSDGVDQQLSRAQHGIVGFDKRAANTANFRNNRDFAEWLNSTVQSSPMYFGVLVMNDVAGFQKDAQETLMRVEYQTDDGDRIGGGRIPNSLNITNQNPESLHDLGDDIPCTVYLDLRVSSVKVEYLHGGYMTFLSRVDSNFQDQHETPGWYGIIPMNANAVMPVPSRGAIVTVHHNSDGSLIHVEVSCEAHGTRQNILEENFQRRWGRWLAPEVEITKPELDEGVCSVETAAQNAVSSKHGEQPPMAVDTKIDKVADIYTAAGGSTNSGCLWSYGVCTDPPTKYIAAPADDDGVGNTKGYCTRHYVLTLARHLEVHNPSDEHGGV